MEVTEVNEVMWPLATKLKTIVMTRKTFVYNFERSDNFVNFERSDNFNNINSIMKKQYNKPSMEVVMIQQWNMLCSSPGARSLSGEGLEMPDGGVLGDDDDDV